MFSSRGAFTVGRSSSRSGIHRDSARVSVPPRDQIFGRMLEKDFFGQNSFLSVWE
jgi:hypothetical protein